MRVLLFNTSPKNYGATQEILNIMKNQLPSDFDVQEVCLGNVNISYCLGCKSCYDACDCVQNDDMETLIEKIDTADILVIAAPSYWADIPGQFKVFIDRCTVYNDTNQNPKHKVLKAGKKCYGIALRTGLRPIECEHIIETISHWCGHMKINMIDSAYFCDIKSKDDVVNITDEIRAKASKWFNV